MVEVLAVFVIITNLVVCISVYVVLVCRAEARGRVYLRRGAAVASYA